MVDEKLVAVITGAAQGLGKDLTMTFAKNGYTVIATDIIDSVFNEDNIYFVKADLKSEQDIQNVFDFAVEKFGSVQVLINNGAISKFYKDIRETTVNEFEEIIKVNLTGSFICSKAFVKANNGAKFGRIINIASTRWHQNEAGWEAYGASKGALVSLTNTLCVSLIDTAITVNAISPGWIQISKYEQLKSIDHKQHPSGRVGKPEDISHAALFLANERSDFINGVNLLVDGGITKKMIFQNSDDFWNAADN